MTKKACSIKKDGLSDRLGFFVLWVRSGSRGCWPRRIPYRAGGRDRFDPFWPFLTKKDQFPKTPSIKSPF